MSPSVPLLVGVGFVAMTLVGITGLVLGARTSLSTAGFVGILAALGGVLFLGLLVSPAVRQSIVGLSFAILLLFPIYALFWTLNDFVERTVRPDQ